LKCLTLKKHISRDTVPLNKYKKVPDSELITGLADAADDVLLGGVHDDPEWHVDGRQEGETNVHH
jgi:hypothetical protein